MSRYFEMLMEDVRFREGLKSCMNCGICTGVCPAAEFYDYDPRQIVAIVQTRDEEQIERLLKGDTIWFRAAIRRDMSFRRCVRCPKSWAFSSRARRGASNSRSNARSARISCARGIA